MVPCELETCRMEVPNKVIETSVALRNVHVIIIIIETSLSTWFLGQL